MFRLVMRILLPVALVIAALSRSTAAIEPALPLLYNHVTGRDHSIDKVVAEKYGKRYRVVEITDAQGKYQKPRYLSGGVAVDVTTTNGKPLSGYVLVLYVLDAKGRVTDPVVVTATDPKLNVVAIEAMLSARFTPATWNDNPVQIVAGQEFHFPVNRRTGPGA